MRPASSYAFRGSIAGRRRPLCVRGLRVSGPRNPRTGTDREGGSGYADRRARALALTCDFEPSPTAERTGLKAFNPVPILPGPVRRPRVAVLQASGDDDGGVYERGQPSAGAEGAISGGSDFLVLAGGVSGVGGDSGDRQGEVGQQVGDRFGLGGAVLEVVDQRAAEAEVGVQRGLSPVKRIPPSPVSPGPV